MAITPVNDNTDKSIVIFLSIPNKDKQASFEAYLRQELANAHIVNFNDGQSLISELQRWKKQPDMIFFNHPLSESV